MFFDLFGGARRRNKALRRAALEGDLSDALKLQGAGADPNDAETDNEPPRGA